MTAPHGKAYLGDYRDGGRHKPRTRTVVKANYVVGKNSARKIANNLRYYQRRSNSQEVTQERDIFSRTQDKVEAKEVKAELNKLLDKDARQPAYRIILSPDTVRDTAPETLKEWTRTMMNKLEHSKAATWFAVAHTQNNAHTDHGHVHVVAILKAPLTREDFATLRQQGDVHWQDVTERKRLLEQDDHASRHQGLQLEQHAHVPTSTQKEVTQTRDLPQAHPRSYGPEL